MNHGEVLDRVNNYFAQEANDAAYRSLLSTVETSCKEVKRELGEGVVYRVYGRAEKQSDHAVYKSRTKIAMALIRTGDPTRARIEDVADIIGLTIVVNYPDQISAVADLIINKAAKSRINAAIPKQMKSGGYYATHVNLTSDHQDHRYKKCEVQIKTVLHDAWGAKTHDLTYKPKGPFDRRFESMMQVFGDALDAIDKQSEVLRDLIEERWRAERQWRRVAGKALLETLPNWQLHGDAAKTLRQKIEQRMGWLRTCPREDEELQEILAEISRLGEARERYLLEALLAISRDREDGLREAIRRAREWLGACTNMGFASSVNPIEIWSVPLVMQACDDIDGAVEAGEQLLSGAIKLSDRDRALTSLNLANHMIEREYYKPSLPEIRKGEILHRIEELVDQSGEYDLGALIDTKGMICVVFSENPQDIREAIDKIAEGRRLAPEHETDVATAYFELNTRLAWRRLLDLEARRQ
jgi:ppGpp synthetase/RelA/SpoT-type nucleotidyltranferase